MLESVTDAEFLVKNAKLLCHSEDPVMRNSVFINADLTKAETICLRRQSFLFANLILGLVFSKCASLFKKHCWDSHCAAEQVRCCCAVKACSQHIN